MSAGITTLVAAAFLLLLRWKMKIMDTPIPMPMPMTETDTSAAGTSASSAAAQVPCYFIFGDSLSDCGNNNDLHTLAKANYKPYGIDFPAPLPTGRFSNNRTFVDILTELLGFEKLIPGFNKSMSFEEASQGVNYASGGAGILYETGRRDLGTEISFFEQILHHETIVEKYGNDINLTQCFYTINIGSNDYINNYYSDDYITSKIFTTTEFASILTAYYRTYIKLLYGLGARKIAFSLLTEIGCALGQMAAFNTTSCVESVNDATAIFNSKLVPVIEELSQELPDAKFLYINATAVATTKFIEAGITVYDESCCTPRSDGQCKANTTPCTDRSEYYFWDQYHPTDIAVQVFGAISYNGNDTSVTVPYDISALAKM